MRKVDGFVRVVEKFRILGFYRYRRKFRYLERF